MGDRLLYAFPSEFPEGDLARNSSLPYDTESPGLINGGYSDSADLYSHMLKSMGAIS